MFILCFLWCKDTTNNYLFPIFFVFFFLFCCDNHLK